MKSIRTKSSKKGVLYPLSFLQEKWARYAVERWSSVYSDIIVTVTERDKGLLLLNYPELDDEKIKVLSVSMPEDSFVSPQEEYIDNAPENLEALFVASDWPPNVDGLKYYLEKVMPFLPNVTLHVAGKICLKESELPQHSRVIYHGYVPDLTGLYRRADFISIPVFWGGGMKVKIVQALQHGKIIFAPTEAFVGYRVTPEIGEVCDDANVFIEKINHWIAHKKIRKFNPPSRKLYESEYHPKVLEQKLRSYLNM